MRAEATSSRVGSMKEVGGMTRVALYARVSTNEQTVAPQLEALRSYGSARGLEVVREFVDEGISGSADRCPALNEMIAAACT